MANLSDKVIPSGVATAAQGTLADSALQPSDNLTSANLTGALPAISGAALTGIVSTDSVLASIGISFTSSGSYTVPAGAGIFISCSGGGGSGGISARDDDSSHGLAASGGGAGGTAFKYVPPSASDLVLTITIGAGGAAVSDSRGRLDGNSGNTSTVTGTGISLSATGGGAGGSANSTGTGLITAAGAAGGTATGGDENLVGGATGDQVKASGNGYAVGAGAMVNGGDIPAFSGLRNAVASTNTAYLADSTRSLRKMDFGIVAPALGGYIWSSATASYTATGLLPSNGCGSAGVICGSDGDSSTGQRIATSSRGGGGVVYLTLTRDIV